MEIRDKVCVVTGASAGIGASVARKLARVGGRVVLVARRPGPLEAFAAELREAGGEVHAVAADIGDPESCGRLIQETLERYGAVDVLVNNAGLHHRGPVRERTPDELAAMVDVNLRSPVLLTALVLPHMTAAGAGAVVNVASLAGCVPTPGSTTYSATKFGLRAFGYALNEELLGTGVTISAVSPGPVDTGFIMDDVDNVTDLTFSQPIRTADQVADAVVECIERGRLEIKLPLVSGWLTTLGYLFPRLGRALRPSLRRRGAAVKRRLRAAQAESGGQV